MKATVLVVDDDPIARQELCGHLESKGFRALNAVHGREALAVLEDELPALIVVDLEMPVMDGWKLVEALRCYEDLAGIPVVLMTDRKDLTTSVSRTAPVLAKPLDYQAATETLGFMLERLAAAA